MAKIEKSRGTRKSKREEAFPFGRENYLILLAGVVVIILGYLALSGDKVEGFMPLTLAPILLVIGYCVIVPIGIMYRKKDASPGQPGQPPA